RNKDMRDGYREASKLARDKNDRELTRDLQQAVRQQTGMSLTKFMEQMQDLAEASLNDPHGVAQRIAWATGEPTTVGEAKDLVQAAQRQQVENNTAKMVDRVSQTLPGYAQLEGTITAVLSDPGFPRTGNPETDMRNAHHIAGQLVN